MKLPKSLIKKIQIYRYNVIENILSMTIGCVLALFVLCLWSINELNEIKHVKVYPQIYKIYAPTVIDKIPEDIIEETELKIIKEAEHVELEINPKLNKSIGVVQGPQETEKYYNLPMDNVIINMRKLGYTDEDYPYYITDDGIKMLGDFIIVATDLNKYPRGTVVQTTLGQGLVCDHCETPDIIDLAVDW